MPSEFVLITGASRGIGRSTTLAFADKGFIIYAVARKIKDLESLKCEVEAKKGKCIIQSIDLTLDDQLCLIEEQLRSSGCKVRALIHNAGIARVGLIKDLDINDWRKTIELNLTVPFILTHKLFPYLSENCHIFFINSVAGRQTFEEWSAYCASKWALKSFADTLRKEVSKKGIKVTSIFPSSVDTPLHDHTPYDWDRSKMLRSDDVAQAILTCFFQPPNIQTTETDLENISGTF